MIQLRVMMILMNKGRTMGEVFDLIPASGSALLRQPLGNTRGGSGLKVKIGVLIAVGAVVSVCVCVCVCVCFEQCACRGR